MIVESHFDNDTPKRAIGTAASSAGVMLPVPSPAPIATARIAGTAMTGVTVSTASAAKAVSYVCMTDDGYGRKRPCSAGYKAANPNWRAGDSCFTDEGYGRYRPCSAGYKAKQSKK